MHVKGVDVKDTIQRNKKVEKDWKHWWWWQRSFWHPSIFRFSLIAMWEYVNKLSILVQTIECWREITIKGWNIWQLKPEILWFTAYWAVFISLLASTARMPRAQIHYCISCNGLRHNQLCQHNSLLPADLYVPYPSIFWLPHLM